jgi:hypothetical protein
MQGGRTQSLVRSSDAGRPAALGHREALDAAAVDVREAVALRICRRLRAGPVERHHVGIAEDVDDRAADELGECVSGGGSLSSAA